MQGAGRSLTPGSDKASVVRGFLSVHRWKSGSRGCPCDASPSSPAVETLRAADPGAHLRKSRLALRAYQGIVERNAFASADRRIRPSTVLRDRHGRDKS